MLRPVPHRLIAACVSVGLMTVSSSLLQAGATNATSSQLSQTSAKCDLDPRSYGAKGDGVTFDTEALQKAIDLCSGTGGRVVLSSGIFLTKPLELYSKMTLCLEKGAVLLGSPDIADYPVLLPPNSPEIAMCRSLLYAYNANGLLIEGEGVIDGNCRNMHLSKEISGPSTEKLRPSLLRVFGSMDVTVRDVTFLNPCMWTQVYRECDQVLLDHVTVDAPPDTFNLDGMDICDCSNVIIRNCDIRCEDDGICLKSHLPRGLQNILIEGNKIFSWHANGIKLGTATVGPVSHVVIRDNTISYARYGALVIASVDGSQVHDILVEDLKVDHAGQPLFIRLGHRQGNHGAKDLTPGDRPVGSIEGITIKRMHASGIFNETKGPSCTIGGIPGSKIRDVSISDSSFEMPGGDYKLPEAPVEKEGDYPQSDMFGNTPGYAFFIRHADGIELKNVSVSRLTPDARPWLAKSDAEVKTVDCSDAGLTARRVIASRTKNKKGMAP